MNGCFMQPNISHCSPGKLMINSFVTAMLNYIFFHYNFLQPFTAVHSPTTADPVCVCVCVCVRACVRACVNKFINIIIIISVCNQTKVSIRECSSKLIVVERVWSLKLKVQFIILNHMSSVWDFSEPSVVRCVLSTFFPSITHSEKHEPNCQPVSQSLYKPTQILCKHTENLSSFTVSFVSHAIQGS